MLRRSLLITLLATLISIPAMGQMMYYAVPQGLQTSLADYDDIKKVAILSFIGDLQIGETSFWTGKQTIEDIADWNLDDRITAHLKQLLGNRFQIIDIPYDRKAYEAIKPLAFDNNNSTLRRLFRNLPRAGIDAFLIVRPKSIGLWLRNGSGDNGRPSAEANFFINLVDARSLIITARSEGRIQESKDAPAWLPGYILSRSMSFDEKTKIISAEQRKALQAIYYRMIPHALLETVRALEFGADLPPVGGRSEVPRSAGENPYDGVKSIAILSAVGDEFGVQKIGNGDSQYQLDISDWDLNAFIEAQAKELLGPQFVVRPTPMPRGRIGQARLINADYEYDPHLEGIEPSSDIDAYLVFLKHPFQFRDSMITGLGAGLVRFSSFFRSETILYAYYDAALIDARTLKVIKARSASIPPNKSTMQPSRIVDSGVWAETPKDMTAARKDQAETLVKDLIGESLRETLLKMDLTGSILIDSWPLPTENDMEMAPP